MDSSLWASGRTIDIAGEVDGDVFCAGMNVTVSGKVHGDVICAAQNIRISGTVDGDVRAAAQTISLSSQVKNNLTAATQTFTLDSKGQVGGDASVAATDSTLNGAVSRDLSLASETATIASRVGRNIKADVDQLNLSQQARVGGQVEYTSKNEAAIATGAVVTGKTTRHEPERESKGDYGKVFPFGFGFAVYMIISLLLVALTLALLLPRLFQNASDEAARDPFKTLLVGFAASILVPALIVVLMITIIGIPLGLLLLVVWLLIFALSGPAASYHLGRSIFKDQYSPILTMLAGAIIVLLGLLVPILGFFVFLAALWMGVGMLLLEFRSRRLNPPALAKATKRRTS